VTKERHCAARAFVEDTASASEPHFPMTTTALFSPYEVIDGDRSRGLLLIADHARRLLPDDYGSLGLPEAEFERHIAYDIGVEPVTRRLAALLGVPAVMAGYSGLLVDPNGGGDDQTLIRQLYDGTIVTGNYPIDAAERQRRLDRFHRPYHDAIGAVMASVAADSGRAPFLFSIHSFTPVMQGRSRPWHAGVLWDRDPRAALPVLEMLAADRSILVGDNEPYDGALRGDTLYRHAIVNGFAHALVEVRQDLIADEAGAEAWARRLAPVVDAVNALPDIHVVRQYGSRTGPVAEEVST